VAIQLEIEQLREEGGIGRLVEPLDDDPAGAAIGALPSGDTFVGDPLFCNAAAGNFDLSGLSPALRAPCGPIGARGQGCSSFKLQPSR